MCVVFVERLGGSDEVRGDSDVAKYVPHVLVVEARESNVKVEQKESPIGV